MEYELVTGFTVAVAIPVGLQSESEPGCLARARQPAKLSWLAKGADRGCDDCCDGVGVRNQGQMRSAVEDSDLRVGPVGHREFRGGRDDLVIRADEVPGRDGLPRRVLRRGAEGGGRGAALGRPQPLSFTAGQVAGEVADEDVFV